MDIDAPPVEKKSTPAKRIENGRILARENEQAVLLALNQYGFLSAAQLQALVWPASTQPRVAQRTLKRLVEDQRVQRQFNKEGRQVYALTAKGAGFLRAALGIEAASTLNVLDGCLRTFNHRSLANDLCIWWQTFPNHGPDSVFTEYNIQRGRAPIARKEAAFGEVKGKIPDGLWLLPAVADGVKGRVVPVVWCEVEMSNKRGKDYEHLIKNTCNLLGGYGKQRYELSNPRYEIHYVVVACPNEEHEIKFAKGVLVQLATVGWKRYNWDYVHAGVMIWRPHGECITLLEWLEKHPDVKVWNEFLKTKWRDKNFGVS